jgi:hypothetical protein
MPVQPLSASGRLYAVAAFAEALTWTGLLIGMWLKYGAEAWVPASRLRWPGWALLLGMLAAIPPLVTMPLEWWLRRKGLLSAAAAA